MILEDTEAWSNTLESAEENNGLKFVGGVDISFVKGDAVNACAAYVIVSYPDLKLVYKDLQLIKLTAPYIPGFLAFRETPSLMEMIERQRSEKPELGPDVIMVDGNGTIHPRKFGLACHLGVLLDIPCLGVAKTLFQVDGLEKNPEHKAKCAELQKAGDTFPLIGASGDTLGVTLRSRDNSPNPIYVSPGHRLSLDTASDLVARCCKFRIPEPTRQADVLSREYLRVNFKPESEENTEAAGDS